MGGADSVSFDPAQEYGGTIDSGGFGSGREFIDAIIAEAKKVLPPNTDFWFISWNDETGRRRAGWVYNLQTPREKQKLFNPLKPGEPLRT